MKRFIVRTVCFYVLLCVLLLCLFSDDSGNKIRNAEVNDIVYTITKYYPDVDYAISILQGYKTDYIVIGEDGEEIASSRKGLVTDYQYDYIHRDISAEIIKDGENQGRIIFINDKPDTKKNYLIFSVVVMSLFLLKDIFTMLYLRKHVLRPIKKINEYAREISKGSLDIPVSRVDSSFLGAFSESFDMMREELVYTKRKEQDADRQRREVIAAISHDIKNPVASIQAIAEFQLFSIENGDSADRLNKIPMNPTELRQEFQTIIDKTNQINGLVSNLHASTINDLEKLEINPQTAESTVIKKALRQADFKKWIGNFEIPECLIVIDYMRFLQVVDNIISNSYKYADTEITVSSYFDNHYLCICIRDYGNGVKKDEEVFLTQKYFRGENAKEKEGSGIGLYIAEYLMKGMGGTLICRAQENAWFEVEIRMDLA